MWENKDDDAGLNSPVKQLNILPLLWELVEFQVGVVDEWLPDELLGGVVELEWKLGLSAFESYPQRGKSYSVQSLQSHFIRNYTQRIHGMPLTRLTLSAS